MPHTTVPDNIISYTELALHNYSLVLPTLSAICVPTPPESLRDQIDILTALTDSFAPQLVMTDLEMLGANLFGLKWQYLNSDWPSLNEITRALALLYLRISQGNLPSALLNFLASKPDMQNLKTRLLEMQGSLQALPGLVSSAFDPLQIDRKQRFGSDILLYDLPFAEIAALFGSWASRLSDLQSLTTFNNLVFVCRQEEMSGLAAVAESWPDAPRFIRDAYRRAWFEAQLERAYSERRALVDFNTNGHLHIIQRFRDLDLLSIEYNRARLAYAHWNRLPTQDAGGQLGVLRREVAKKTRHIPIRVLMERAGNAIQAIKPVFMMSPLSIATYLPPGSIGFDMIVFDEASQVRPVDAFGALLRGKQAVVVGDTKQLPPTSFFDSLTRSDTDEDEDVTADLDSILHLFASQDAPERMHKWHYRSRHESLIAVSNYQFYGNQLVVFPSPDEAKEEGGLTLRYLPNTAYDRGKSRTNLDEAKAVAQAVMDHARTRPEFTLGVAAFSVAQMQAILEQIELLRRQDPSCEPFFSAHPGEPFFVKNLENVQGDERDIIFISIGYGRTAEGTIAMDFGPLNRKGGERRLNVLITRARVQCVVFTNLSAEDIDLERSASDGVRALKSFLSYAQDGRLDIALPTGHDPRLSFEEEVLSALNERGYQVRSQVGSAGFRIDLAVVDPRKPGRYLLGIECDGATYHSARTARDRDRLRQMVLENLGWRIHRIWSTDWFRDPQRELDKLVEAIATAASPAPAPNLTPPSKSKKRPPLFLFSAPKASLTKAR